MTDVPGLYMLGMLWQYTRGSALVGWVNDDAQHIVDQISTLATVPVDAPNDQRRLLATT